MRHIGLALYIIGMIIFFGGGAILVWKFLNSNL